MSTGNMGVKIGFLILLILGALGDSSARQLPHNLEGTSRILFNCGVCPPLSVVINLDRFSTCYTGYSRIQNPKSYGHSDITKRFLILGVV